MDCLVVGCGLSGSVAARYLAEKRNWKILVVEKRNHIGGNMYDYRDANGILVHKYGPHTFHTNDKRLYDYISQYESWTEFHLKCGAVMRGKYTPTPFNFRTIDQFYEAEKAAAIKAAIAKWYGPVTQAPVTEMLQHDEPLIREYAEFLFRNDYQLYTAKQWGISPDQIDPSVLKRVPVEFSYREGYFTDRYQVMPVNGYVRFFDSLLKHPSIEVRLNTDALESLKADPESGRLFWNGSRITCPVIYTGAIDELFRQQFGKLPYRSLRFEWKTLRTDSFQDAPVVAYPEAEGYTRITEYKKLPVQDVKGITTIAVEYPLAYQKELRQEAYYPIPGGENQTCYERYRHIAEKIPNLHLCGRLADYKYYNMDQVLSCTLRLMDEIAGKY